MMKHNLKKISIAAIVSLLVLATFSSLALSTASQPTVILTYSNLGRNPIYWGNTASVLRANGWNVIDLVPTSYQLAVYEKQIEQQLQRTPHAALVSFSDSDLPCTVAALKYPSLVSRIVFVESIEDFGANPISDQLLGSTAVTMTYMLPSWIYAPIFTAVGLDRTIVGSMMDSMVKTHPANYDALVAATADGTAVWAYVDVYNYAQTQNWHSALSTLRSKGVPMTAITSTPDTETWANNNALPSWEISNSGHLCQLEQPQQFNNYLIASLKGYLA
jgi:pimeloyl-ACP methyl ester carboxylesterase